MGRLLPDSLTWRFALLLAAALIAANVVAGVLLSTQRQRLDDAAREAREIERITSLVPALEAVSRSAWRAIERDASTRFSRIRITESPVVEATASDARSRELAQRIMEALPGRSVAVAVVDRSKWYSFRRRAGDRHETGADEPDTIAVSVALDPGAGAERAEAWLNLMSFAPRHMRGEARPGAVACGREFRRDQKRRPARRRAGEGGLQQGERVLHLRRPRLDLENRHARHAVVLTSCRPARP